MIIIKTLKTFKGSFKDVESMHLNSPFCDGIVLDNYNPLFNDCLYHMLLNIQPISSISSQ